MLDLPLVFLDLETTGARLDADRITEVGLVEIRDGEQVERWSQLVNPQAPIPAFIESLTGISDAMVADAPAFHEIAAALFERLDGKLLVAHNARFDYGFLKSEFRRAGFAYRSRVLCTAKLSRALFPEHRRHNLDSLIERHGLACSARHRALGDAEVLWQFVRVLLDAHDRQTLERAVQTQIAPPRLPPGLAPDALEDLPESPGVYVFYGTEDAPLYVGRAADLRASVWSHFGGRGARAQSITPKVRRVDWTVTAGELGAHLLESRLVQRLSPARHRADRHAGQYWGFEWTGGLDCETSLRLAAPGATEIERLSRLFGLFRSSREATDALAGIAGARGLCPVLLGLEPPQADGAPCAARLAGRCRGACCAKESVAQHNVRLIEALQPLRIRAWPFPGAIAFREGAAVDCGDGEFQLFDRWCHLGSARTVPELGELAAAPPAQVFDLDVYRILCRVLDRPRAGLQRILIAPEGGSAHPPAALRPHAVPAVTPTGDATGVAAVTDPVTRPVCPGHAD